MPTFSFTADEAHVGHRADRFLAAAIADCSRAQIKRAFDEGHVSIAGQTIKPSHRLRDGETLTIELGPPPARGPEPEDIPLDILYEDDALLIVDKPHGMITHPAKGNWAGTLAAAAAFHCERLSTVGGEARPGIVHRLDRDTSGAIVIAKTDPAHRRLTEQFAQRQVEKEYWALVTGRPDRDAERIDRPIGPHGKHREKMAIREGRPEARPAQTLIEVAQRFRACSLVKAFPTTGRTHQIRVHLLSLGHPILCDPLYGRAARITRDELLRGGPPGGPVVLRRLALHARRIKFAHPLTGNEVAVEAPLPEDLAGPLAMLRSG